jgi:hypothetical protein
MFCSWWDSSKLTRANTCSTQSLSAAFHSGWQKGNVTLQLSLSNEINICHPVSNCKLSYHCAKPTIKINIQADLSSFSATDIQHISETKWLRTDIYIITDFPTGVAVATFQLMASHNYLAAHFYMLLLYPFLLCVLCKESKYIMYQGHFPNCTVLYPGNTPSTVTLYWNDSRPMELLQTPKNQIVLLLVPPPPPPPH